MTWQGAVQALALYPAILSTLFLTVWWIGSGESPKGRFWLIAHAYGLSLLVITTYRVWNNAEVEKAER